MSSIALKMLFGDRVKLLGILLGMTLATVLIAQQGGLFHGLMTRAQNIIADARGADIWVMHPATEQINLARRLDQREVLRVRSVHGVEAASPLLKARLRIAGADASGSAGLMIGLDETTWLGAPRKFLAGKPSDLMRPDAIAMDRAGFRRLWPSEPVVPGKTLELNGRRAIIVAITDAAPAFGAQVIIHTRRDRATRYVPTGRRTVPFIVVRASATAAPQAIASRIAAQTGLKALTRQSFSEATVRYYVAKTGITINFATTIILGIIVGTAIVGLTFGLFVSDNLSHYATLKMLGVTNLQLLRMVLLQVGFVAIIGFVFGVGLATAFFEMVSRPESALRGFYLPWWIPVWTFAIMLAAVLLATLLGLKRVLTIDPATALRGAA